MKILWISSLAWKWDGKSDVKSAGAVSGSLFQQKIIEGIEENGHIVEIVNSYPYFDSCNHSGYSWSHNNKSKDYCIAFKKKKYANLVSETRSIISYLKREDLNYDCVIAYLVHLPFLNALKKLKRGNDNLTTILICPDLSNMMDLGINKNPIKKVMKSIELLFLRNRFKYVDKYVLFSKYMKERMPIGEKPYIVIEGVNSISTFTEYKKKEKPFIVLYAGSLQYNFGIENIIKAFSYLDDKDIEFHIYGNGPLENFIIKCALKDSRIKFFGFIDHSDILQKECEASLLINARDPSLDYTRYSFPSKTFEYMMSGTPFLTTRLEGIPDEYFDYLFGIKNADSKSIAESILSIKNYDFTYVKQRVENGELFLLKKKNNKYQSKKLLDFIAGDILCE